MTPRPLYGLVLAGGRSARMQRDKAALPHGATTQLTATVTLLARHAERVFVSVRAQQRHDPLRARFSCIFDRDDIGPMGGLVAAQAEYPDAAWLVVACDLPRLDDTTLAQLIEARDGAATAFTTDGHPEPLCAVYEPASARLLATQLAAQRYSLRELLVKLDATLLQAPEPAALANVNTPEEYAALRR